MKIYVDELPESCAECKCLGVFGWCNCLKDCVVDAIKQSGMGRTTFLKYAEKYGYSRQIDRYEYHLTGDFVDKIYHNQNEIMKDLGVSQQLLKKYFSGEKTVIDRMGLKIERIKKKGEENE